MKTEDLIKILNKRIQTFEKVISESCFGDDLKMEIYFTLFKEFSNLRDDLEKLNNPVPYR